MAERFSVVYQAMVDRYGCCPIEWGLIGNLADHECEHGRLPGDPSPACGCWSEAMVVKLRPTRPGDEPIDAETEAA